jgi:hypothetical protein
MQAVGGWTLRTGGRPFVFVKTGRNTIPAESKLGVDHFDTEADVEAFARQHNGLRGNDDKNSVDHDTDGIVSTGAQTPPIQNTQPQYPGRPLYTLRITFS